MSRQEARLGDKNRRPPKFIALFIRIHFRENQCCKVLQRSVNAAMNMRKQKE
jgi:hypothetical protein